MTVTIEVRNELRALRYDINKALEMGQDSLSILTMINNKLSHLEKADIKEHNKIVWKK